MNINVYVIMHKLVKLNLSELYSPLLVGSYDKKIYNILRDDTGDNISEKNENYCELTGLYWIWKNIDSDIVGICHYRRFLTKNYLSNNNNFCVNKEDIIKLFNKNYNLILPKKHRYKSSVKDNLNIAPNKKDMEILKKAIEQVSPEYINDYNIFMNQNNIYLCNILISKKELFDEYCEWLFNVLYKTEELMNPDTYINDSYRKRMFGFLSERLLNIWIIHNQEKLKIKELSMINTEEKLGRKIKYKISQIRNMIFFNK